ncbi:hypothetical protein U1Q18_037201 [Sarracenia purpurea var. burkii]
MIGVFSARFADKVLANLKGNRRRFRKRKKPARGFENYRGDFGREDDGGTGLVADRRCGDPRSPGRAHEERIPALYSVQGLARSGLGFGSTQREEDGNNEVQFAWIRAIIRCVARHYSQKGLLEIEQVTASENQGAPRVLKAIQSLLVWYWFGKLLQLSTR